MLLASILFISLTSRSFDVNHSFRRLSSTKYCCQIICNTCNCSHLQTKRKQNISTCPLLSFKAILASPFLGPCTNSGKSLLHYPQLFLKFSCGIIISIVINYDNHMGQRIHFLLLCFKVFLEMLQYYKCAHFQECQIHMSLIFTITL